MEKLLKNEISVFLYNDIIDTWNLSIKTEIKNKELNVNMKAENKLPDDRLVIFEKIVRKIIKDEHTLNNLKKLKKIEDYNNIKKMFKYLLKSEDVEKYIDEIYKRAFIKSARSLVPNKDLMQSCIEKSGMEKTNCFKEVLFIIKESIENSISFKKYELQEEINEEKDVMDRIPTIDINEKNVYNIDSKDPFVKSQVSRVSQSVPVYQVPQNSPVQISQEPEFKTVTNINQLEEQSKREPIREYTLPEQQQPVQVQQAPEQVQVQEPEIVSPLQNVNDLESVSVIYNTKKTNTYENLFK